MLRVSINVQGASSSVGKSMPPIDSRPVRVQSIGNWPCLRPLVVIVIAGLSIVLSQWYVWLPWPQPCNPLEHFV